MNIKIDKKLHILFIFNKSFLIYIGKSFTRDISTRFGDFRLPLILINAVGHAFEIMKLILRYEKIFFAKQYKI